MTASALIELVAFDAPKPETNVKGVTYGGWKEMHCARAGYKFLRGGETVLQARLAGQQTVVVTIRNCAASRAITHEWRMRDVRTGAIYNIRSVIPTDDRRYLELTCQSGVAT